MKFIILSSFLLLASAGCEADLFDNISNFLRSARDIGSGLARALPSAIPTVEEVLDAGKQKFAGYPFEVASEAINILCSTAISSQSLSSRVTPDIELMNFYLRTPCKNFTFPLTKAEEMLKSEAFDATKKVVIFATGWTNTINDSRAIQVLSKPYFCRDDVNFIVVDAANFVDTLYTWSALNTDEIGRIIAQALTTIIGIVPTENIHLIGHSLGAHIVGSAGRHFTDLTGQVLQRITGLDPAKPCFSEGESLSGLMRGDALFVDVIHSNPGVLGKREPTGDVDFYPGGLAPLAPGSLTITDSHGRAVEYFAESSYPGNEYNFMAKRCTSLTNLHDNKCTGKDEQMGYGTPTTLKGNYFLDVNTKSPYGQASASEKSKQNMNCGLCQN